MQDCLGDHGISGYTPGGGGCLKLPSSNTSIRAGEGHKTDRTELTLKEERRQDQHQCSEKPGEQCEQREGDLPPDPSLL